MWSLIPFTSAATICVPVLSCKIRGSDSSVAEDSSLLGCDSRINTASCPRRVEYSVQLYLWRLIFVWCQDIIDIVVQLSQVVVSKSIGEYYVMGKSASDYTKADCGVRIHPDMWHSTRLHMTLRCRSIDCDIYRLSVHMEILWKNLWKDNWFLLHWCRILQPLFLQHGSLAWASFGSAVGLFHCAQHMTKNVHCMPGIHSSAFGSQSS
jgi:hypothetical protein